MTWWLCGSSSTGCGTPSRYLRGYVDADVEFHALLARATRNEVLLTMLEPVVDLLRASRRVSAARPGNALRALGEHERILRRVEAGDAGGAREEMRATSRRRLRTSRPPSVKGHSTPESS